MNLHAGKTIIPSLHNLAQVPLTPATQAFLDRALARNAGEASWLARKVAEARQLAAVAQVAPRRLELLDLDLRISLHAILRLVGPVPCRPDPDGPIVVAPEALLALDYRQEAVRSAMPGWAFITVLQPHPVWLANVSLPDQRLCLGARLPAGIRVRALIQMTWAALTLQTYQVDPLDPAGVLNPAAAEWWQQNLRLTPLTREALLPDA